MKLALFDFDGTLTRKDTLLDFIRFSFGNVRFITGMMLKSPYIAAYKMGLYPNWRAKERVLKHFFGGMQKRELKKLAQEYVTYTVPSIFRSKMVERLKWHQSNGDTVWIVSASPEDWIDLFSATLHVQSLGTKLQERNGVLTGNIEGKNCYGQEKVERIRKVLDLTSFEEIFVYGDSRGDREMMALGSSPEMGLQSQTGEINKQMINDPRI